MAETKKNWRFKTPSSIDYFKHESQELYDRGICWVNEHLDLTAEELENIVKEAKDIVKQAHNYYGYDLYAYDHAIQQMIFVSMHGNTSEKILETMYSFQYMSSIDFVFLYAIAKNQRTPDKVLVDMLYQLKNVVPLYASKKDFITVTDYEIEDVVKYIRISIAENRSGYHEVQRILLQNQEKEGGEWDSSHFFSIENSILKNAATDVDWLCENFSENIEILCGVAENPKLSVKKLIELSSHKNKLVRESVAKNPNTPEDNLRKLSKDPEMYVRSGLFENPKTPQDILDKLSKQEDLKISVAKYSTSEEILRKLYFDGATGHAFLYHALAENPKTPRDILSELALNRDRLVRCKVSCNPNATPEIKAKIEKYNL